MALAESTPVSPSTFPEDWHANLPTGPAFELDPMHHPFPLSPLSAWSDTDGFITALREYQVPVLAMDAVVRNYYRFGRMVMAEPASEAEAAALFGPAEQAIGTEVGRLRARWHDEHLPRIRELVAQIDALDPALDDLGPALKTLNAIDTEAWTIHFRIVIPMTLAMQLFDELYADLFGADVNDAHALLVGNVTESIKAGFGLSDLAQSARELGLGSLFAETEADDLLVALTTAPGGPEFLVRLNDYLADYGYRQDLFDYITPTWLEDPSIALSAVRSYVRSGRELRQEHAVIADAADTAIAAARERLAAYPVQVREQFEFLLEAARAAMFLQEEHNFYIDQRHNGKVRLFYLRVGQRLVEAGLLDHPGDVMMLTGDDLVAIANGGVDPILLRDTVATRRRELALAHHLTPPPFLGDTPPSPTPFESPMTRGMARFWGVPVAQPDDPHIIAGLAGSNGSATGTARVAHTLEEARALQPGEILVAVTTMPPWTPLFAVAAAVVTESGGVLSHCAIVAREYGIPAVVGANGATTRIATGQRVTVDGSSGLVTIDD